MEREKKAEKRHLDVEDQDQCCHCGKPFERKTGGFKRVKLHSDSVFTPASVLTAEFNIKLTPETQEKNRFICLDCRAKLKKISDYNQKVVEQKTLLKASMSEESYIGLKFESGKKTQPPAPAHSTPPPSSQAHREGPSTPLESEGAQTLSPIHKSIPVPFSVSTPRRPRHRACKNRYRLAFTPSTPSPRKSPGPRGRLRSNSSRTVQATPDQRRGQIANASEYILKGRYYVAFSSLYNYSLAAKRDMHRFVQSKVRQEINAFTRNQTSCLRTSADADLTEFQWYQLDMEMETMCPLLHGALKGATLGKHPKKATTPQESAKALRTRGVVSSILAFANNKRLSLFQKLNSLQLWLAGCKRKTIGYFARLGWCLGIRGTTNTVDSVAAKADQNAIKWKELFTQSFQGGTGTNSETAEEADQKISVSEEDESHGKDLHQEDSDGDHGGGDVSIAVHWECEDIQQKSSADDVHGSGDDGWETEEEIEIQTRVNSKEDRNNADSVVNVDMQQKGADHGSGDDGWAVDEEAAIKSVDNGDTDDVDRAANGEVQTEMERDLKGYSMCFDNVNVKTTARHQTRDKHNKMFNMVQMYLAKDRISSLHLDDTDPSYQDIYNIPIGNYLPHRLDTELLKQEMEVEVALVLTTWLQEFKDYHGLFAHPLHKFSEESKVKSQLAPLGVLDKNETITSDMVDIIEDYHKWVPCDKKGDPVSIVLFGDGLTCERAKDAMGARINAENKWYRLEGVEPSIQEWHKRQLSQQDTLDELFKPGGQRDMGTLMQLKSAFEHRNVTGNASASFNHNEEFLDFVTDGYILHAGMQKLGITSMDEMPQGMTDDPTQLIREVAKEVVELVFVPRNIKPVMDAVVPEGDDTAGYCWCGEDLGSIAMIQCCNDDCPNGSWFHFECIDIEEEDAPDGDWYCNSDCEEASKAKKKIPNEDGLDATYDYSRAIVWRGLNSRVRRAAIRRNDGDAILRHWKFDLVEFHCRKHPKYFLLGHYLLTQVNGGVSERLRHTITYNRTVNTRGGENKNVAMDLVNEFLNGGFKENIKASGGQLTDVTIQRHGRMVGVSEKLEAHYAVDISGGTEIIRRSTGSARRQSDMESLLQLLSNTVNPFTLQAGRYHTAFSNFKLSSEVRKPEDLKKAIIRLRAKWARQKKVRAMVQGKKT